MFSLANLKHALRHRPSFAQLHNLYVTSAPASEEVLRKEREDSLLVSEIFASVQGEGPNVGRPSVFLRLGMCNLSCSWCDTPYTWMFNEDRLQKVRQQTPPELHATLPRVFDKSSELQRHSSSAVLRLVRDCAGNGVRAVVVTGGEPLLHAKPLQNVIPVLLDEGFAIEFETNGTHSPAGIHPDAHFNVSPKLSNSHQSRSLRINYRVLEEFLQCKSSVFKFVASNDDDLEEIHSVMRHVGIDSSRIYLMPEGTVGCRKIGTPLFAVSFEAVWAW